VKWFDILNSPCDQRGEQRFEQVAETHQPRGGVSSAEAVGIKSLN
jgi:hypothetical protein